MIAVMAKSDKPKRKPADRTRDIGVQFYTDKRHADALQRYFDSFPEETRPRKRQTLEAALRTFLQMKGFWPPPGESE